MEGLLSWPAINKNKIIVDFLLTDALFGKFDIGEDIIVISHLLLLAKFYIYRCKLLGSTKQSLELFKAKLKVTLRPCSDAVLHMSQIKFNESIRNG